MAPTNVARTQNHQGGVKLDNIRKHIDIERRCFIS